MNLQNAPWEKILSRCLKEVRGRHPNLNDVQLATKLGIPRATFNRIKNEQKIPRLDNIIKLVMATGNMEMLAEAMAISSPEIGDKIKEIFLITSAEEGKIWADSELESLLNDRDVFVCYLLADVPSGTTEAQLLKVLGDTGPKAMRILLDQGLVIQKDDRYFLKSEGTLVRSFGSIKHHLNTYARFYKTEHVGKERNYVHSLTNGLNQEGIRKAREAHKAFHNELRKIYRDKNNQGDIPSFSVAFCDTFTSIESNEELSKKEVLQ